MVMVLDAFASYVGHLLTQVAADELGTMMGVSGDINKMGEKLQDLKKFLADADRRNIADESVQEWVGQLKRAMYEATDILDLCQLKAMERGSSSVDVDTGCLNPLLFCMRNPFHAHEIGTRIKALNKRLDNIKQRSAAFSFINLGSYEDRHSSKMQASRHGNSSRETSPDLDRSGVVGEKIKEDTTALVARILQTGTEFNSIIMVIAIVGVGGIGKTTLAQNVFNDEAIQGEFSKKIWLSVNQNFSHADLLRKAIIEAGGDHLLVGDATVALHRALKDALIGHKTLIIMDDVWDHGAWEGVLKIPFVNAAASGSRVLMTTRDESVARGMRATWPYHHVDTLSPDDAWSLLKKQVLSSERDENHIDTLRDIGLKIIQKCGGLPLAVKVMGGLLLKRGELRSDWQKVLDDSKWSIAEMPQELNNAVYLSYEDMPSYLKQCFLYYSLLPKSRKFSVDQVVGMWMSEGFIHGTSCDLEELGRDYYNDLVSRNLIEQEKYSIDAYVCHMHDVVRSFAQYMTKDESLIAHSADGNDILTKLSSKKFLRLSIDTVGSQSSELDWKSLQEQPSVRTLISNIQMKMKPGDSLVTFCSLRTLHMESAGAAVMVQSLHQLKHLRYLALQNSDISALPVNIGKMKLLQSLDLSTCKNLVRIPGSIVKLTQLRLLALARVSMIPRGFRGLTNMRKLFGFQAHMDDNWCSLDELGPLSLLKVLQLNNLENVSAPSFAANARLCEKMHLTKIFMNCTSRLGDDGLVKQKEELSEEEKQRVEKVFDELRPPPIVENIFIDGYFGQQLPSWMMSTSMVPLNNLKIIFLFDLACCTQLPTGLCQLPFLQLLEVKRAPCIKRVGTAFLRGAATPFPMLKKMKLGMVEWEEWEWEQQVLAMPRLEEILLAACKLRCVPPGLGSNARALKKLMLNEVQNLSYLENFPSVVELVVIDSSDLERITNFPGLQKLIIVNCTKLKVLDSIPALQRFILEDYAMEKLPEYMRDVKSSHLELACRIWLLAQLAAGQSGSEWDKFSHVEHVKAHASIRDNRKWYVSYTRRDNFKLDSNISSSTVFQESLSSCMVAAQGLFESVNRMRRSTFSYICSLVRVPFFDEMIIMNHTLFTFVDGTVLSLQDGVAVALRMLTLSESPEMVGSSIGVTGSTVSLVTLVFLQALIRGTANKHTKWPQSFSEMEKIKRKFDKNYGLPNCCGIVHTAHNIRFGSKSHDHEDNDGILLHSIVDPDMRFRCILLQSGSMDQRSIVEESHFSEDCEKGVVLNGSKLNAVSSGGGTDVGEYIIGDVGCPLRPWLLTPYQLEGDLSLSDSSDYKKEFNRRHSEATAIIAQGAFARLKGTWRCLHGEGWLPNNQRESVLTVHACCLLHNIVIDMEEEEEEEEEGAGIPSVWEEHGHVRQIADEDAVKVRDALAMYLMESGGGLNNKK